VGAGWATAGTSANWRATIMKSFCIRALRSEN